MLYWYLYYSDLCLANVFFLLLGLIIPEAPPPTGSCQWWAPIVYLNELLCMLCCETR